MKGRVLLLFSVGLDSLLSAKLLEEQGFKVVCVHYVSPFFGSESEAKSVASMYGLEVIVKDITDDFLKVLASPKYGYGKGFNPCIDCKMLMFSKAKDLLRELGCMFIASGEVVDQRPFSQRVKVFSIIEREQALEGEILRPLSAKVLKETKWERDGIVDRSKLLGIKGRGRKVQLELARKFGITVEGSLSPSGGCLLTDPVLSKRFRMLFDDLGIPGKNLIEAAKRSRFFRLDRGVFLFVGRNRAENAALSGLFGKGFIAGEVSGSPGPFFLVYGGTLSKDFLMSVGRIVARYVKGSGDVRLKFRRFGGDEVNIVIKREDL